MRGHRGMPPAMASVSFVGDRLGPPVEELDLDGIRSAGVPVRLFNYLRMPHGFALVPGAAPAVGRQQRWELAAELRTALAPRPRR